MLNSFYLYNLDFYTYSFLEDILIIMLVYNFIKLLLLSSISELIWPTHYFNRRHTTNFTNYRQRNYIEFLIKNKNTSFFYNSMNLTMLKYFLK